MTWLTRRDHPADSHLEAGSARDTRDARATKHDPGHDASPGEPEPVHARRMEFLPSELEFLQAPRPTKPCARRARARALGRRAGGVGRNA